MIVLRLFFAFLLGALFWGLGMLGRPEIWAIGLGTVIFIFKDHFKRALTDEGTKND